MREIHGLIAADTQHPKPGFQDVTVREWAAGLMLRVGVDQANLTCDEARRLADMLREAADNIETGKTK